MSTENIKPEGQTPACLAALAGVAAVVIVLLALWALVGQLLSVCGGVS